LQTASGHGYSATVSLKHPAASVWVLKVIRKRTTNPNPSPTKTVPKSNQWPRKVKPRFAASKWIKVKKNWFGCRNPPKTPKREPNSVGVVTKRKIATKRTKW
jgi:hypothetical protein